MNTASTPLFLTKSFFLGLLFLLLSPNLAYTQIVAEPTHLIVGRDQLPTNVAITDTLFFFNAAKGAIRSGIVGSPSLNWSPDSLGIGSVAMGFDPKATGNYGATAIGYGTKASGDEGATAIGSFTKASGDEGATAMGRSSIASGYRGATAIGHVVEATGNSGATAMGNFTEASGNYGATAMGDFTRASGNDGATAIGHNARASGNSSVALGSFVSTNGKTGAFFFGDRSTTTIRDIGFDNQFACRFVNGYYFISGSNINGDLGVLIGPNGNAWNSICDSTRKENFLPLSGRMVLDRIDQIPMRSWNYRGVDPTQDRHYGIMAQEFYHAFGHDDIGTIGKDTLVNPIDMLGIAYAAIKELHSENKALIQKTEGLEKQSVLLKEQNEQLQQQLKAILKRMDQVEQLVVVKADE
jgi:FtsZ-binding cell division protein ZapB